MLQASVYYAKVHTLSINVFKLKVKVFIVDKTIFKN